MPRVPVAALTGDEPPGEASESIRARVIAARARQRERLGDPARLNAHLRGKELRQYCDVGDAGRRLLDAATTRLGLSARAYTRILRVARTIADLAGEPRIATAHLAEAIQYRSLDRRALE
jgi:magnesium chelatase family protein